MSAEHAADPQAAVDEPAAPPAEPALPDDEVVRRVRSGDTALFEVVMRRHNQRLYRAVRAIVRDEAEAEDVMQHAYVQAFARLDQFDGRGGFAAWLTRIAVHEAFARLRRRARPAPFVRAQAGYAHVPDPEHAAAAAELRRLLEAAIDRLPETQRVVFVLRDVEGRSTAETARVLGIRELAVRARLHRARALLRRELRACAAPSAFPFHAPRCDRVVAAVLARLVPASP
jgi:RNA polymerase sigma-70 factor (ECF subfamily)